MSIPITDVKGVGEKTAGLLAKLNIVNVNDLINHYPRDYDKLQDITDIDKIVPLSAVIVKGTVVGNVKIIKGKRVTICEILIKDETGSVYVRFFNMPYIKNVLKPGSVHIFRGKTSLRGKVTVLDQPQILKPDEYYDSKDELIPIYPLTKGLSSKTIGKYIYYSLYNYPSEEEIFPEDMLTEFDILTHREALKKIHFPKDEAEVAEAKKRLSFEEFFFFLMAIRRNKALANETPNNYVCFETADTVRFLEALPYRLTNAQKKVWAEIKEDLSSNKCMNRLIQGDVGSGKTIIAFLAMLEICANGYQAALMAPTEVLAKQHFEAISDHVKKYNLNIRPALLVGSLKASEKRAVQEKIKSGEVNFIIGTHALIQDKVEFKNLALVVTDEQHRFGVKQREELVGKGRIPHVIVMSATPIPRTLSIIFYGDLDISVIDELPANRLPIKNCVVNTSYREKAYKFIEKEVSAGHQAYVICPMVTESEESDLENVTDYAEKLREALPDGIIVSYLHGQMKAAGKNQIMEDFAEGKIHVLVSTTVIEVGINVPNATVMMVENSEKFGLSSLHQLRGRVGRGDAQSFCIFISSKNDEKTMERLNILNRSNDGFFIASEDMRLRGPGDMFGVRQSGDFEFKIANVFSDATALKAADMAVDKIMMTDPLLNADDHILIRKKVEELSDLQVDFRSI
ncbi:MAG: ATP-dependent DNA helicase RecG [Acetatifactor sp.]|nr:ATP-dependent DNA helicase RecG [Acetatifactor sp.]